MTERLFSFYGDDFTGSTDALEALASNGVPAVLFLDPPSDDMLARYPECRAIGVAGESRSRSPQWMTENLPAIFGRLLAWRAGICHYKVCSTFDSSPSFGSIGRALEIGQDVFRTPWVPIAVAAPPAALCFIRQPLCSRWRRDPSDRSSSHHAASPGYSDGRS